MSALQFKRAAPSVQRGHKKTPPFSEVSVYRMAERTGLEPATSGVTGQHSNQLNYRSTFNTARRCFYVVGAEGFEPPTLSL